MSRKIIGMISSYAGLTQGDWLWQQAPQAFGVWDRIQMLSQAENPDFLLLYNFCDFTPPTPKQKWYQRWQRSPQAEVQAVRAKFRGVPPERVISLTREPPLEELLPKRARDYDQAKGYAQHIFGPDDLAPTPDYMPAIWYHANAFRELNEMSPPAKVRPCSWITSGIDRTANHRKRLAFLQLIKSNGLECDIYGRDLPPWAQGQGKVNNKWHAMAPYRYNLAIENYAENRWYVSEKMWDSLLAWCLPIYYGGSAADQLLPPGSFLRLPSLDEKGMEYIRDITATPDAWYAAKEAIAEARQVILHKLNLLNWLSEFVARLE